MNLREVAQRLGGQVSGRNSVSCPGPGHSPGDRSLSIQFDPGAPDGFTVYSFSGDDWRDCRDHVRARLGIVRDVPSGRKPGEKPGEKPAPRDIGRELRAWNLWLEGVPIAGTLAETFLREGRKLAIERGSLDHVARFHPRCPWGDTAVPAMLTLYRDFLSKADPIDDPMAVQRTRLDRPERWPKVERMMLGPTAGCAIKIDPDDAVETGLHVAEGFETALAARQAGLRPCWALGSSTAVRDFPVLGGIECLTIISDGDKAADDAIRACGARWQRAGCEVLIDRTNAGDMNDALVKGRM